MPKENLGYSKFSRWITEIGTDVDELVQGPGGMSSFREKLIEWGVSPRRTCLLPLPNRALTLSENYVLLAAIRDEVCTDCMEHIDEVCDCVERIDPWNMERTFCTDEAGMSYSVIRGNVGTLTDKQRERLDRYLADVRKDIELGNATAATPPTWRRLVVTTQISGDDLASLDGKEYRLPSNAAEFLKALQDAEGGMVLASTLTTTCGKRADRIFNSLPDELKSIIDAPGKKRHGYRMLN